MEKPLRDIWDNTKLFKELVAKNFSNLVKNVDIHIQEVEQNYQAGKLWRKSC